jgi:hypothetical protein
MPSLLAAHVPCVTCACCAYGCSSRAAYLASALVAIRQAVRSSACAPDCAPHAAWARPARWRARWRPRCSWRATRRTPCAWRPRTRAATWPWRSCAASCRLGTRWRRSCRCTCACWAPTSRRTSSGSSCTCGPPCCGAGHCAHGMHARHCGRHAAPHGGRGVPAQVLRTLALTSEDALGPFLGELVPCIVGLVQQTLGPTKLAAERTLARVLHVRHPRASVALRCPSVEARVPAWHNPMRARARWTRAQPLCRSFWAQGPPDPYHACTSPRLRSAA